MNLKIIKLERELKKLKKQLKQTEEVRLLQAVEHDFEMEKLNRRWSGKFDLLIKMFLAQMEQAGSVGELKRWYASWCDDLNALNVHDENVDALMNDVIEKHGFDISSSVSKDSIVPYREMIK